MNDTDPQEAHVPASEDSTRTEPAPGGNAEISERAHHQDPSLADQPTTVGTAGRTSRREVVWVRPTDLLAARSARIAGRGLDFHTELARRARRMPVQAAGTSRRAIRDRALRLPPVTAFGQSAPDTGASRSGIGIR